jgi:NodT family efflux transporter outer membrane factor (OMF) lipoprotein
MLKKSFLVANVVVLVAAGCAVGPDFKQPVASLPSSWTQSVGERHDDVPSYPVSSGIDDKWWAAFNDAELIRLEERVTTLNLDVKSATARLTESRAEQIIAGSSQYPVISGNASLSRKEISKNVVDDIFGSTSQGGSGTAFGNAGVGLGPFNLWRAGFDASWEIDLWGRARRVVEAANASYQEQEDVRRGVLLSSLAETARDYIQLRGVQVELRIADDSVRIAEDSEKITRERHVNGFTTELDVENAAAQVADNKAIIPQLQQQEAHLLNDLSLLLGEPPGSLSNELSQKTPIPPVPPQVPVGLPAELARRRPDIRQAEAALHEATASIGVAVANFYPRVTLTGSVGLEALTFPRWGDWNSRQFAIGPAVYLPIFQGGKLKGVLELRKGQQQVAAINYEKTVLQAWHDVDNALTQFRKEQQRRDQLVHEVEHDQRALLLAREQYKAGLVTFLNVLDDERSLLLSRRALTQSTTTISTDLVALYKALGGGWESTYADEASR